MYEMGVQIPSPKGAILRAKRGRPRTCRYMSGGRYTQSHSAGGSTGTDAAWNVLNGAHIGDTWRIRLDRLRVAAIYGLMSN